MPVWGHNTDSRFEHNWRSIGEKKLLRGAYHYYRPNENSIKQADNFIRTVTLGPGDLPPILDIEALPQIQSITNLKVGLERWLSKVESHFGVKPIIYSGDHFFRTHLDEKPFNEHPILVANYSRSRNPRLDGWTIWQFSEKGSVKGIRERVDLNVYSGNKGDITSLLVK